MMAGSDEEFGLSSSDEAELLNLAPNGSSKRKSEDDLANEGKRSRNDNYPSRSVTIARRVLKERFQLEDFRLKQELAIERLLDGGSSVVVFPTGGGKSFCYQVPALCFKPLDSLANVRQGRAESGITLVVSPLIALMKDQVDALRRRGINAAVLDSTKTREEYLATVDSMRDGTLDILYCAPERLNNEGFVASMSHVKGGVRLLAVDEAHCISEWGHSFRPDYLKVARFSREIAAERVVCLTATATPKVAKDVCEAFKIPEAGLFRTPTYRPNLRLLAESYQTKKESYPQLRTFLKAHPGPTIIYVTLQKQAEQLAELLSKHSFKARHFHAGMEKNEKMQCQDEFMASDSLIIVATIAFGMGIDKSNIRNVIHYDIPGSLEGYSQEIGRAGRDGLQSQCVLFLCAEDFHLRESFVRGDLPSKLSVSRLLHTVFASPQIATSAGSVIEANVNQQSKEFDIKPTVLNNIYAQLELRFDLLRATTPKYTSYKFKSLKSTDDDRSPAAVAVRKVQRKAKVWTEVDVDSAARSSGLGRPDVVAKLNEWHDHEEIDLSAGGVVNIYRVMNPLPTTPAEKEKIINDLYKDLELREQQDLRRMEQVIDLVTGSTCFARALAQHFGDSLPNGALECGHCTWCETKKAVEKVTPPKRPWNSDAFFKILQACPDRDDPRFLARVAFGISSPRVTAARLSRSAVFGSMEDQNFMTLLESFTKICKK